MIELGAKYNKSRLVRRATVAALAVITVAACSSPEDSDSAHKQPEAPATTLADQTTTTEQGNGLVFETHPDTNFSVNNCVDRSRTYAVSIDSDPYNLEDAPTTVGIVSGFTGSGSPIMLAGATYQGLGNARYEIATSANPESHIIDLADPADSYSQVLPAAAGEYAAILSVRNGEDGNVYFDVSCLPNFGYSGENDKTFDLDKPPVQPAPTTPPASPTPSPSLPEGTFA